MNRSRIGDIIKKGKEMADKAKDVTEQAGEEVKKAGEKPKEYDNKDERESEFPLSTFINSRERGLVVKVTAR